MNHKNIRAKIITGFLLTTLVFCSTGCILTRITLHEAGGDTGQRIPASQIKKGDQIGFDPGTGIAWVIQYPTNKNNSNLKMPEIPRGFAGNPEGILILKPKPALYALMPFTFSLDVIFFPVEMFMVPYWFVQHS